MMNEISYMTETIREEGDESILKCFLCSAKEDKLENLDGWSTESSHFLLKDIRRYFDVDINEDDLDHDEDLYFCTSCSGTWTRLGKLYEFLGKTLEDVEQLLTYSSSLVVNSMCRTRLLEYNSNGNLRLYLRTLIFLSQTASVSKKPLTMASEDTTLGSSLADSKDREKSLFSQVSKSATPTIVLHSGDIACLSPIRFQEFENPLLPSVVDSGDSSNKKMVEKKVGDWAKNSVRAAKELLGQKNETITLYVEEDQTEPYLFTPNELEVDEPLKVITYQEPNQSTLLEGLAKTKNYISEPTQKTGETTDVSFAQGKFHSPELNPKKIPQRKAVRVRRKIRNPLRQMKMNPLKLVRTSTITSVQNKFPKYMVANGVRQNTRKRGTKSILKKFEPISEEERNARRIQLGLRARPIPIPIVEDDKNHNEIKNNNSTVDITATPKDKERLNKPTKTKKVSFTEPPPRIKSGNCIETHNVDTFVSYPVNTSSDLTDKEYPPLKIKILCKNRVVDSSTF